MRSAPDTKTHRIQTEDALDAIRAEVGVLNARVVGNDNIRGLCDDVRTLQVGQANLGADVRELRTHVKGFDAKLDKLLERAKSETPAKRKSIFAIPKLRSWLFIVGALGDIGLAVHASVAEGGFSWTHAIAAAFTALAAFSLRWPTDVTKAEADEREQKARLSSVPPPL